MLEKNEIINEVEQSTLRINEIMNDMGVMVDEQGEQLDVISEELMKTTKNMADTNNNLEEASSLQKKSRRKYVFLVALLVLIIIVVAGTGNFSSELARTYLKQLLSAISYLADVGITHRDLKPENILFDRNFNLKVSDFGLARDARGDQGNGQLTSRVGTEGYRAPEVEGGCYEGLKADLFALGVILFIMYKGTPPFLGTRSHDRIYRLIRERRYAQFWQLH
ncbi:CBL-interacting protein kinase 26 [Nymphaea colorata]|uniref:CBL-interacting protein kinase 26 n=1 Tax=Nymphaea colorata TaxID=210225 RepID=UPI00129D4455|nr:CBL-interacting protein kinase 26 [Nymphaea colorata]